MNGILKKTAAEFFGTFWLVFGGVGSAIYAGAFPELGIGFTGVSLAFGLTVVTMAYAVGHISGGHFNPAVSFGLWVGKRFSGKDLLPYIIAQVLGAVFAGLMLYLIAGGKEGFNMAESGFGCNGYGEHSVGGYSMTTALIAEVLLTAMFLIIIMGVTDKKAPAGFAPLAIGLALALIHLISIPIDQTSVNPARSTGVALIKGGWAIQQLWLFWVAPIVGGILGGLIYNWFGKSKD